MQRNAFTRILGLGLLLLTFVGGACLAADARSGGGGGEPKTTLRVAIGFDDQFRPGRWTPIAVIIASDRPRDGRLVVRTNSVDFTTMLVEQSVGVGPAEQKYYLYAPLLMLNDPLRVTLFDRATGELLAVWPIINQSGLMPAFGFGAPQIGFVALTTGRYPVLADFERTGARGRTIVSHRRATELPLNAIGYDSADLVVLNEPDWQTLDIPRQTAMIDWVRQGGTLFVWPGLGSPPPGTPLVKLWPVDKLSPASVDLTGGSRSRLNLSPEVQSLPAVRWRSRASTSNVEIDQDWPSAVVGRVGLGRVVMLPINPSAINFASEASFGQFWNKLLTATMGDAADPGDRSPDDATALQLLKETLPANDFNPQSPFSVVGRMTAVWVALATLAFVLGPVEWVVQRRIGANPWTLTTVGGWMLLIGATVALGATATRTPVAPTGVVERLEQAGDAVVHRTNWVLEGRPPQVSDSSAASADEIRVEDEYEAADTKAKSDAMTNGQDTRPSAADEEAFWWSPVSVEPLRPALPRQTRQTQIGNLPLSTNAPAAGRSLLRGDSYVSRRPVLRAVLHAGDNNRLSGTITNLTDGPMTNITVLRQNMSVVLEANIAAGATVTVDNKFHPTTTDPQPVSPFLSPSITAALKQGRTVVVANLEPTAGMPLRQVQAVVD